MRICTATLKSVSSYSQSGPHETPKLDKETPDAHEKRTWLERTHATSDGDVYIPPMGLKMGLSKAAKMIGTQIPGKGKATYTKFFESGVLILEAPTIGIKKADMRGNRVYVNSDGVRGSGKRVWRIFPTADSWQANVAFTIFANEITKEVFEEALRYSGMFVGIGQFRPENGGYFGRYEVIKTAWS